MMNLTVEVFRQQVQARRGERRRGAPRYPEDLVAFAVKHVRATQAAGRSLHAAAAELGLSSMTLDEWLSRAGQSTGQRLREVVVREATAEAAPNARTVEVQTASVVVEPDVDLRGTQLARHATERDRCNNRKSSATERAVS